MNDMTDDTRRKLAAGLAMLVRAAMAGYGVHSTRPRYVIDQGFSENVYTDRIPDGKDTNTFPPLTTGQMLGLSALLGGEVESRVLADWLTEQGADWAEAVAEKARQEERARCLQAVLDAHNAASSDGLPWDGTGHLIYETISGEDRQHADAP